MKEEVVEVEKDSDPEKEMEEAKDKGRKRFLLRAEAPLTFPLHLFHASQENMPSQTEASSLYGNDSSSESEEVEKKMLVGNNKTEQKNSNTTFQFIVDENLSFSVPCSNSDTSWQVTGSRTPDSVSSSFTLGEILLSEHVCQIDIIDAETLIPIAVTFLPCQLLAKIIGLQMPASSLSLSPSSPAPPIKHSYQDTLLPRFIDFPLDSSLASIKTSEPNKIAMNVGFASIVEQAQAANASQLASPERMKTLIQESFANAVSTGNSTHIVGTCEGADSVASRTGSYENNNTDYDSDEESSTNEYKMNRPAANRRALSANSESLVNGEGTI